MNDNVCGLVAGFVADQESGSLQLDAQSVFDHLRYCERCAKLLDGVSDEAALKLFEALSVEGEGFSVEEGRRIDRYLVADKQREEDIRRAVRESLLPGLSRHSRSIANGFDPVTLYAATEAVSMLIRHYLRLNEPGARLVQLHADGSVWTHNTLAIPGEEVADEIARFANLWGPMGARTPEAIQLAGWVFLAAHDQPRLFEHFHALPRSVSEVLTPQPERSLGQRFYAMMSSSFGKVPTEPLTLTPLQRDRSLNNLFERWRPVSTGLKWLDDEVSGAASSARPTACLYVYSTRSKGAERPLYAITRPVLQQLRGFYASKTEQPSLSLEEWTVLVTDELPISSIRSEPFRLPDNSSCMLEVVGTYSPKQYEKSGYIELTSERGRRVRTRAHRVDFPFPVKVCP